MIPAQTEEIKVPYGAIARRTDGDYSNVDFICPTNGREYTPLASRPPVVYDDPVAPYVSISCYWCDTSRRLRGEPGFDRDKPQPHGYLIMEDSNAD